MNNAQTISFYICMHKILQCMVEIQAVKMVGVWGKVFSVLKVPVNTSAAILLHKVVYTSAYYTILS